MPDWGFDWLFYLILFYVIYAIFKTFLNIKLSEQIDRIHESEHVFQEALQILNNKKNGSKLTQTEERLVVSKMEELVELSRVGFKEYQKIDVSVNLKIIKTANVPNDKTNKNQVGTMYASTLLRCESDYEKNYVENDDSTKRSNDEKFILEKKFINGKKIVKDVVGCLKANENDITGKGYKINSAFYIAAFIDHNHYWITNSIYIAPI